MLKQLGKSELKKLIQFFRMAGSLKRIPRSGWVKVGVASPESVADHTFRTAILCMTLADLGDLDGSKLLRMALLHDLPEAIIGDLIPSEKTEDAANQEGAAMKQLLNLLPEQLQDRYTQLWREYREQKTREAKVVRELEKLEMVLQAKEYKRTQPTPEKLDRFVESADRVITSPEVRNLLSCILKSDC
jgi:putative hydrolase of HD superfamily